MASQQAHKIQVKVQERDEDELQQQSSQDDGLNFLTTARNMVTMARKRRDTRRKTIQDEHVQRRNGLSYKINAVFETRKKRVEKIQKTQWNRLDALNKKRLSLESQIIARMKSIEQHTANISGELSAMLEGRMEEAQGSQAEYLN